MKPQLYLNRYLKALLLVGMLLPVLSFRVSAQYAVDAAFFAPGVNKVYLFRGDEYIRIDAGTNSMDAGYPIAAASWMGSLPVAWQSDFDAMTPRKSGSSEVFVFKGTEWLAWDYTNNSYGGPFPLSNFQTLPANFGTIRAAVPVVDGFYLYGDTEWAYISEYDFSVVSTGTLASLGGTYFDGDWPHLDAAFANTTLGKREYIRGTQTCSWNGNTFVQNNLTTAFANWGWQDAVQPFNLQYCDLDVQLSDNECGGLQEIPFILPTPNIGNGVLGVDVELHTIGIHLKHTYIGDLAMSLISPSGVEVLLIDRRHGSNDDFGSYCGGPTLFGMGYDTLVQDGNAPLDGGYVPEGDFADFNDGTSMGGKWKLRICDMADGDVGILERILIWEDVYTPPTATDDALNAGRMTVYPNPSTGRVQVQLSAEMTEGRLQVVTLTGQLVSEQALNGSALELDLSAQPAGMYLVRYLNEVTGQVMTERLSLVR